jgi:putative sterol carrier protein
VANQTDKVSKQERFQQLVEVVKSDSSEEVADYCKTKGGGYEPVLDLVFDFLPTAFKAERAQKDQGSFQYDITTPDGPLRYFVRVDKGTCATGKGTTESPDVTIAIDFVDFLQLGAGKLSGGDAYMTGRLQVSGDVVFAMKWQGWFATF